MITVPLLSQLYPARNSMHRSLSWWWKIKRASANGLKIATVYPGVKDQTLSRLHQCNSKPNPRGVGGPLGCENSEMEHAQPTNTPMVHPVMLWASGISSFVSFEYRYTVFGLFNKSHIIHVHHAIRRRCWNDTSVILLSRVKWMSSIAERRKRWATGSLFYSRLSKGQRWSGQLHMLMDSQVRRPSSPFLFFAVRARQSCWITIFSSSLRRSICIP